MSSVPRVGLSLEVTRVCMLQGPIREGCTIQGSEEALTSAYDEGDDSAGVDVLRSQWRVAERSLKW